MKAQKPGTAVSWAFVMTGNAGLRVREGKYRPRKLRKEELHRAR